MFKALVSGSPLEFCTGNGDWLKNLPFMVVNIWRYVPLLNYITTQVMEGKTEMVKQYHAVHANAR